MSQQRISTSKTQRALDYLAAHPEATPCAAARAADVAPSVVYRAIKARSVPRCPFCGRPEN